MITNNDEKNKNKSMQELIVAATSVAASVWTHNVAGVVTSLGPLLFALKARFLDPLKKEYTQLQGSGLIKEDYYETEQFKSGIQELFDAIENDLLDETVFNAMKKVFLITSTETESNRNDILPLEYLRLCRKMASGEIILLYDNYKIWKNNTEWKRRGSVQQLSYWVSLIAKESALKIEGIILLHEQGLIDKLLLKSRHSPGEVGIDKETFRLTGLGIALFEYIEKYDSLLEENHDKEG